MIINDIFEKDVTRDIPPVIYFHEQNPEKLADEVSEYVITGGYPDGHPQQKRVPNGIHEQYIRLLRGILAELEKPQGPELPTVWISGFYGSGKSSFAKLFGLALDDITLPSGQSLADALLARDISPKAAEFRQAWHELLQKIDPIAVVFDIGGVARDDEHIHSAVVRQVQKRLGYCPTASLVADYELRLERDGRWEEFLTTCQQVLGKPWEELKDGMMAEDDFSQVLSHLFPDRYLSPTAWFESRAGLTTHGLSANEATAAIRDMMEFRAPGKTLFLVVDEVSQYLFQEQQRMLAIQSFASDLGQRLRGRAWLLVTGQQKLEEEDEATVLGKLKGRFPPHLRIHLAAANIRDVVHKRLLLKKEDVEDTLNNLFQAYRSNLQLFAHDCDHITSEDFQEVYPMLPGHIDLLMEITSAMRIRSSRIQGDTHAIRGLIQLLGELFREKKLAQRPLGTLITFDDIYDIQSSALDTDTQTTMAKIQRWCAQNEDEEALRAAKAVALLQLVQDTRPTTLEFIARCLYDRLDRGDNRPAIKDALERLRTHNLLSFNEKQGYKLQSSAGQDWVQERDRVSISHDEAMELIRNELSQLLEIPERPRHHGTPFPFTATFTDNSTARDMALKSVRNQASVPFDFRFVGAEDRSHTTWIERSEQEGLKHRIIWVVGQSDPAISAARELGRSRWMIRRYDRFQSNLKDETFHLLLQEKSREDELTKAFKSAIDAALMSGQIYFRGQQINPVHKGQTFNTVLHNVGNELLPALYPDYISLNITETELDQLLSDGLAGSSLKFMEDQLGILKLDAGTPVVTADGRIPSQILRLIENKQGLSGQTLLQAFTDQPYGYHPSIIRACLIGLLRAKKIVIHAESGLRITSYRDPGTQDLFRRDRDLRLASIFPVRDGEGIGARDRNKICRFFHQHLDIQVDREDEAIADTVFNRFPGLRNQLKTLRERFSQLPGAPDLPPELLALGTSIDACTSSRRIEDTVISVRDHLDTLQDGVHLLRTYLAELTDDAISTLRTLDDVLSFQFQQLTDAQATTEELQQAARSIKDQLASKRPWREAHDLNTPAQLIRDAYQQERQRILDDQAHRTDDARDHVRIREGFADLNADQKNHVLRPIHDAFTDTDAHAIAPTLLAIKNKLDLSIPRALDEAHNRLDNLLASETPIVKVRHGISNQTITSPQDLDRIFDELRRRVEEQLQYGHHVRLY